MRLIQLFMLFFFIFQGCTADDLVSAEERTQEVNEKTYPQVDEALWPFFEKFEDEALKRGLSIDLSAQGIVGQISEISETDVAGRCNYHSQQPELVTIDKTFWNSATNLWREMVVFHELGHCQLIRDHRESLDRNGQCRSIMASGIGGCQLQYSSTTRSNYLDELFDEAFAGDWFR